MKRFYLFFLLMITACNKNPSADDIQAELKSAMLKYIYEYVHNDSVKVKYRIDQPVIYYEEKTFYNCQFTVRMIVKDKLDTTGIMRATISKDFKDVKRFQ
ncbi:MAG: hypothetical protein ABI861_03315 [Panacibacter sp.]